MIKIGIVDDEKVIRNQLRNFIEKQRINAHIREYGSADEYAMQNQEEDLLFLDIGMTKGDINGMELAHRIRRREGKQPIIIFVTGFEEFVYEAFDVKAFHYLRKPVNEEKFQQVLHQALESVRPQMFQFQYGGENKSLPIDEIYFIESQNHKIKIYAKKGEFECYAKIGDIEVELAGKFFRIHKGYLINMAYVDSYNKTEVLLENGTKLLISKYKYANFVQEYMKFLMREMGYDRRSV